MKRKLLKYQYLIYLYACISFIIIYPTNQQQIVNLSVRYVAHYSVHVSIKETTVQSEPATVRAHNNHPFYCPIVSICEPFVR